MDAFTVLQQEHRRVLTLFDRYDTLAPDEGIRRRDMVGRIIQAVQVHGALEEEVFYPNVREEQQAHLADLVRADLACHHAILELADALQDLGPDDEAFDAKVRDLEEQVRHLVATEERELFPRLRERWDRERALEVGARLEARRSELEPTGSEKPRGSARV